MLNEIGRIIISILLLALAGVLYWLGFRSAEVAMMLGATNAASVIVGAEVTYWLKPS